MPALAPLSPGQTLPEPLLRKLGWPSAGCQAAVILFVRGPWCPVCRRQITRFAGSADELAALGVPIVIVSTARNDAYSADERLGGLPVRYLADPGGELMEALGIDAGHPDHGVIARPATAVIDQAGRVRFAHIGTHTRDRPEPAAILLAVRRMLSVD